MSGQQTTTATTGRGGKLSKVLIVGAGPSGLLLSILLARQGISTTLLEQTSQLDEQPRAAHYAPPAIQILRKAGVLDDVAARGFKPSTACWRKVDGSVIAKMTFPDNPDAMVVLPLNRLGKVLYAHVQKYEPIAKVNWSHRVVDIGQDEKKAWAKVETPEGVKMFEADYVVGCDGGNSKIRRALFGEMNFPGETLDAQIIATNVYYDFTKFGYLDTNYIVDPDNWHMVAKIANDGLYRVSYCDKPGLTPEEYKKRQPMRFQEFLPGSPKPGEYRITNISPYKLQQRCAPKFRVGRFILAADAAHLCNPFGGLGLTGGIADVGSLYDCLVGIHKGLADDSILDKYAEIRRKIYTEVIDPSSRENFYRLSKNDPEKCGQTDPLLVECQKAEKDPQLALEMSMFLNVLLHDFTQYYTSKASI
ncbi:hypothetical protein DTO212C5_3390 [Paecilomyces variotii]|nr:hypothetical protein DTO212C5_3390 [Paecilomyces variotii]